MLDSMPIAAAKEVVAKLAAADQLSKAIEAWLQAKQGTAAFGHGLHSPGAGPGRAHPLA